MHSNNALKDIYILPELFISRMVFNIYFSKSKFQCCVMYFQAMPIVMKYTNLSQAAKEEGKLRADMEHSIYTGEINIDPTETAKPTSSRTWTPKPVLQRTLFIDPVPEVSTLKSCY